MPRLFTLLMLAMFGSLLLARTAGGESLRVIEASVLYKASEERVYFDVWFNQAPSFEPAGSGGGDAASDGASEPAAPEQAFQIFLDVEPDGGDEPAFPWEVVARGGEIPTSGGVPIRDAQGRPDLDDPNSGGWGQIVGIADYRVDGTLLSFSAPNAWVGATDRGLSYELLVTEDGEITNVFVPTPTAAVSGLALLAMLTARKRRGQA